MKEAVVGVLLAAGSGNRFGGDKLLHPLADGTPLVAAAARTLAAALPGSVGVVRPGCPDVAALLAASGLDVVVNATPEAGMGASLACGVSASAYANGWVVALGDMPWIRAETVAAVADALRSGAAIAAPVFEGRRGHPVGFARRYFDALAGLRGDAGARGIVEQSAGDVVALPTDDGGVLLTQPRQESLEQLGHVGVVGMDLVKDHGLARQTEHTHKEVASDQYAEKRLVDCANTEGC